MTVWVLTSEVNDYDQYGEYFEAVFESAPTEQQLLKYGVAKEDIAWVQTGGGRKDNEYSWFWLREEDFK